MVRRSIRRNTIENVADLGEKDMNSLAPELQAVSTGSADENNNEQYRGIEGGKDVKATTVGNARAIIQKCWQLTDRG